MNGKILFIDDNVDSGKMVTWAMESLGHEIRTAVDGIDALRIIKDYVPNIVVCDISMPGVDGYHVCRAMKADPRFSDTLFIAQTGWDTPERKKLTREAGFDYHMVKPVDINALLEILTISVKGKATV